MSHVPPITYVLTLCLTFTANPLILFVRSQTAVVRLVPGGRAVLSLHGK